MGEEFFKPFIIVQELEAFVRKHHFKNELIRDFTQKTWK